MVDSLYVQDITQFKILKLHILQFNFLYTHSYDSHHIFTL